MDLTGKNVLITGASRGIGEALAQRFAQEGAHVVGVARNAELLGKVMADVGGTSIATDLGDPAQVDGLIARVERDAGPVDVLVNNAGLDMVGALVDTKAEDIRTIHQVNLVTPVELCRQVLPGMLMRGRGHIVNVSSLAGVGGFAGMTSYCSTKGGLTNFTGVLRLELKGTPIGTTLVELGPDPDRHARPGERLLPDPEVVRPLLQAADARRRSPRVGGRRSRRGGAEGTPARSHPQAGARVPAAERGTEADHRDAAGRCAQPALSDRRARYTGITPCLRHGRSTCFVRDTCRPLQIARRVSAGSMTSSTWACPAAM